MDSAFAPRDVQVLASALPPDGANAIGRATRDVLITHIKRATPGNYSQLIGTGPAFRAIFFPRVGENPHESQVSPLTGLDGGFFAGFAVAMVCQQIQSCTSRLRPQMLTDQIGAAVAGCNGRLRPASYRFYAYMAGVADSPVRPALAPFSTPQARAEARRHYLAGITSPSWVNAKETQDRLGEWPDRDWELFHHWIKLTALDASLAEIDAAIRAAMALGLPVPGPLGPGQWHTRTPWFGADIGGWDAADATEPMLKTRCWESSCLAEDNSFEFTARTQPGNGYRRAPSSSCLAPGTQVVLADGSLRAIEDVAPGDIVASPEGGRRVLLRSEPHRAGRTLYRFDGTSIVFAASHPFLLHTGTGLAAAYAAADPGSLARDVPTLSQFGIASLEAPARPVLVRHTPGGDAAFPAPPVIPDHDARPDLLYDLYLEVGADGRSEYYAGDHTAQLLVSSEVPRFAAAPATTEVVLHVLEHAGPAVLEALADVPDESFADLLAVGLDSLARTMMPVVGPRLRVLDVGGEPAGEADMGTMNPGAGEGAAPGLTAAGLAAAVRGFAGFLGAAPDADRRRMGTLVEAFTARFAPQFQAVLALPWRCFDLATADIAGALAVTLYSVELFQPGPGLSGTSARVTLARGPARYERSLPVQPGAPADRWYYSVDRPVYFPEWAPPGPACCRWPASSDPAEDLLWELEIGLSPQPGSAARMPLPRDLSHGYEMFAVPILDRDGTAAGQTLLDVRLLTTEAFVSELRAQQEPPGDRPSWIARRLAELAASYVRDSFAPAVSAFRFCAATTQVP